MGQSLLCGAGRRARTVVLGKKKKNARAHAGRQAKLRLDGSKLGQNGLLQLSRTVLVVPSARAQQASVAVQWLPAGAIGKKRKSRYYTSLQTVCIYARNPRQ